MVRRMRAASVFAVSSNLENKRSRPKRRFALPFRPLIKAPLSYVGVDLSPATKAKTAALQNALQGYISELTAQREKAAVLVNLIPDQTARTVIELRYGLIGSGCELMPYPEVGETLNYADKTILSSFDSVSLTGISINLPLDLGVCLRGFPASQRRNVLKEAIVAWLLLD